MIPPGPVKREKGDRRGGRSKRTGEGEVAS